MGRRALVRSPAHSREEDEAMNCRRARWTISHALNGGVPLPPGAAQHAARCTDCGRFLDMSLRAEGRLREEAMAPEIPGVAARVMRRVEGEGLPDRMPAPALRYAWIAAAAALLLVAIRLAGPGPGSADMATPPREPSAVAAGVDIVADRLRDPLEEEALRIAEDVRDLGDFLIACVLPSG
jgi:hypothetical protein